MDKKETILVVEDETYLSRVLNTVLTASGYKVIVTGSAAGANTLIASNIPDLILLDLGLPDMDGIEVLSALRKWSDIPVIIVSARGMDKDKITTLDMGADDYVTKPFSTPELLARIRAALRHSKKHGNKDYYSVDGFFIDFSRRQVTVDNETVHLTRVEYQIVELIARQPGCVLTYDTIIKHIWGPYASSDNNRILRINMANIRRKIEKDTMVPRYILTEIGVGYRMAEQV
ncbi:Transcriptional regulatory protein KdpE [bioreactor metagenome]|uniref:Transcriptional regulatory protein KdpE n=1 Tax=bioreactor metagenome TaxID=1076179 RepID=A0A645EWE0_9ZZZZ